MQMIKNLLEKDSVKAKDMSNTASVAPKHLNHLIQAKLKVVHVLTPPKVNKNTNKTNYIKCKR